MNNSNGIVAINEQQINKLILDISDCSNRIKIILNKINDLVLETRSYYNCTSADKLRAKYELFSSNYNTIIQNLMSYGNDFSLLKKKCALNMDDLSVKIRKDASKMNAPTNYKEGR